MTRNFSIRLAFLAFIILMGTFIRLIDLGTHFAHIDDLGVAKTILTAKALTPAENLDTWGKIRFQLEKWTTIPQHWTYAPAQFFLTHLLVNPNQNYRQILFWGRFPSFIYSILGLLLWIYFYRRYDRLQTPAVSISSMLLAFSWMNIVYAKQMESYAIGVFSAVLLWIVLWEQLHPERHSLRQRCFGAFILAILCHTQYQVLFFAPAYFLTLLWHDWNTGNKKKALLYFIVSGLLFAALIYPMYTAFLKRASANTAGVTWNAGPHNEFILDSSGITSPLSFLAAAIPFFIKNTFIVFGSIISPVPENHIAFPGIRIFLFALFILGIIRLFQTPHTRKKRLGIFLILIFSTWIFLVCRGKLAYSPTRHSLILLPFMVFLTAEGWLGILSWLHQKSGRFPILRWATLPVLLVISGVFLGSVPGRLAERKDPFDEQKILSLLQEMKVDALFATHFTHNASLMPSVLKQCNYFESETMEVDYAPKTNPPFKTIAFISQREKLTSDVFGLMRFKAQLKLMMQGKEAYAKSLGEPQDYQPIYVEEKDSEVQIDPNTRTQNGSNGFYFYVLQKK